MSLSLPLGMGFPCFDKKPPITGQICTVLARFKRQKCQKTLRNVTGANNAERRESLKGSIVFDWFEI